MDEEEYLAVDAICSLKNGSLLNTALPNVEKKIKKQKKSYYVKKKIRDKNLPLFPLKAPRNFHLMPTADPRTDYPRLVIETLAADADKFEALLKRIGAPDLLAVFQHHAGEQNPLGPNYREVLGLQNFIDFYLAVVHAVPDLVLTIIKDSIKCSRDPDTNEAFIVFKVVSLGTQVMFIQEKVPGEEERELAEMMNPPVHDPATYINNNSTTADTAAPASMNTNVFSTYNRTEVNNSIVGLTSRAIKLSRGNHSASHTQPHNNINSTSNSNINSNSNDYINSINSTINSTFVTARCAATSVDLDHSSSEDHSSTHSLTHGSVHLSDHSSTHSSTRSDKVDSSIDIDNLVSSFNSFKLEPVLNRPLTTVYHYGTYVIVTDGNYKITKWLNFFKQTVGQAPAFPGMGTGVRDDVYVGGGNKTK